MSVDDVNREEKRKKNAISVVVSKRQVYKKYRRLLVNVYYVYIVKNRYNYFLNLNLVFFQYELYFQVHFCSLRYLYPSESDYKCQ